MVMLFMILESTHLCQVLYVPKGWELSTDSSFP